MAIPVYVFAGFLESGKTTFIESVLTDPGFTRDERSLLVLTEEGEVEIERSTLVKSRTIVETIDSEAALTSDAMRALVRKHHPDRIIVEFNGMWSLESFVTNMPSLFDIYEIITTVNGETFETYINNMGARMIEQIAAADMIVFNRCDETRKAQVRARNIKAMNPRASIYFETPDGQGEGYDEGMPPPFDLDAPIVEIADEDFGLFYMDAMNSPERYEGKIVRFKGMVYRGRDIPAGTFVPGRMANVCCAEDIRFVGMICKSEKAKTLEQKSWVTVTAQVKIETMKQYRGEGPVLYAQTIEPAQAPAEEVVGFN